jgi:outer membrane protein OmpA-like peptidoglycan-associated protein
MAIAVFGQTDSVDAPRWLSIGAALSGGATIESGNTIVPELCDSIDAGSGTSFYGGAFVELPIAGMLSAQFRLGAYVESGELRAAATRPYLIRSPEGIVVEGTYDNVLTFDRTMLAAALGVRYELGRLDLLGGLELVREIATSHVEQRAALTPSTLLFNGRRVDDVRSGVVVEPAAAALGLLASIGYSLPISRHAWLVPELSLATTLSDLAGDDSEWRRTRLAVGASVRFDLLHRPEPVEVIDTPVVVVHVPVLRPAITTSPAIVEVRVDEYDSTEAVALLNQVFFDEGSAALPAHYRRLSDSMAARFSIGGLVGSALDVYYDLLNIVGFRMNRLSTSTLTVNGYRNGRESDRTLGRRRAEAIRRYLLDTWRIAPGRIKVTGGGLPASPARETVAEGYEENARAHLDASDPNVVGPIIRNHIKRIANPPSLVFYPRGEAEAGVRSWNLDVMQDSILWKRFAGEGAPPDSIVWDWRSNDRELPTLPMKLGYELAFEDSTGQRAATERLPITVEYRSLKEKLEHRRNDTVIESYSLLLFNFDSPNVSPADQELLRAIAGTIVEPTAVVRITGYTDSLGLESHNRELALRRAAETARILKSLAPAGTTFIVDPNGGERERFPFDSPEGRSHNRTVVIEVRRPAKPK